LTCFQRIEGHFKVVRSFWRKHFWVMLIAFFKGFLTRVLQRYCIVVSYCVWMIYYLFQSPQLISAKCWFLHSPLIFLKCFSYIGQCLHLVVIIQCYVQSVLCKIMIKILNVNINYKTTIYLVYVMVVFQMPYSHFSGCCKADYMYNLVLI
jgi:hypothetical protein